MSYYSYFSCTSASSKHSSFPSEFIIEVYYSHCGFSVTLHIKNIPDTPYLSNTSTQLSYNKTSPPTSEHLHIHVLLI